MILVTGATGTLGRLLVPLLLARGEPVRVLTRDPERAAAKLSGVEFVAGDVTRIEHGRRAVEGARVVVSAITGFASPAGVQAIDAVGNATLAEAAAAAGVEHFVLMSVSGASADHPIPLFRAKFAAEQAVRRSGIPSTFIRPTAYLETWLGLLGGPLVTTGRTMVFGRGRNPINFVSAGDVARFVDQAVAAPPPPSATIVDVPGPENLTLDQLVAIIETASGRSGRVSHTPRALMRLLSIALRPINRMRADQVATALVMDTRDMTVDGPAMRAASPSIPMTTASIVAGRIFGPTAERAVNQPSRT
jgi:NADH dehydrogenase